MIVTPDAVIASTVQVIHSELSSSPTFRLFHFSHNASLGTVWVI